jgi:hypothetical protein
VPPLVEVAAVAVSVVAVVALASLSIVVAVRWIAKRPARPGVLAIGCCVAVGLVAATPVQAGWHDGCNGHGGKVALIEAPRDWFGSPTSFHTTYTDIQTLMSCIRRSPVNHEYELKLQLAVQERLGELGDFDPRFVALDGLRKLSVERDGDALHIVGAFFLLDGNDNRMLPMDVHLRPAGESTVKLGGADSVFEIPTSERQFARRMAGVRWAHRLKLRLG